jgi:hypothetical protein
LARRAKTTGIEAAARAAMEAAEQATVSFGSVARVTEGLVSIQSLAQGWQSVGQLAASSLDHDWSKLLPDVTVQAGQTEALDELLGGLAADSWRDMLAGPGTAASVADLLTDPISSAIALRHTWANSDALAVDWCRRCPDRRNSW